MRYIDADELLKHYIALVKIDWNNKVSPPSWSYAYESFIDYLAELPTADVVPKSEVEKLNNELMIWKQDRFNLYQRLELYEITRQKVAREIFEEIEKLIYSECFSIRADRVIEGRIIDGEMLAELKKKYTEDKE